MNERSLLSILLTVIIIFIPIHASSPITIFPREICRFTLGKSMKDQIPNYHDIAEAYFAPENIIIDNDGNVFILIPRQYRLIKISSDHKQVLNYDLFKFGDIISLTIDRSSNKLYALQDDKIIILTTKIEAIGNIEYREYFSDKIYFERIRVINNLVYIYESDYAQLYRLNVNGKGTGYVVEKDFRVNNDWIGRVSNVLFIGHSKYTFINSHNIKIEIPVGKEFGYLNLIAVTNEQIFLSAATDDRIDVVAIGRDSKMQLIKLHQSDERIHSRLPVVTVDQDGNIYQLCLIRKIFYVYKYVTKDMIQ